MQAHYPEAFDREMGCTEAELLRWLPHASRASPMVLGDGRATLSIGLGQLSLIWQSLPPREIALLRVPRLAVSFRFSGIDSATRHSFMRYFDLYTQRGGG